jgi:hypothetical protein
VASPASSDESSIEKAWNLYRKGMKDLGRSLIVLGVLQFLLLALISAVRFDPIMIVALGTMILIHCGLGFFAVAMHYWVNPVIAVWSTLLLVSNYLALGGEQPQKPRTNMGPCFAFLIAGAMLYCALKNRRLYREASALTKEI